MALGVLAATAVSEPDRSGAVPQGSNGPSIAFSSDRGDGDMDIFLLRPQPQRVTNPDGSVVSGTWIGADVQPLTSHPADDSSPSWSPPLGSSNASWIAFDSNRAGRYDIFTMSGDGSAVMRLTTDGRDDTDPAWSPTLPIGGAIATRIAFVSTRSGNGDVYVMAPDGSGQTRLTATAARESGPTWSPDGSRIAFVRLGDIWIMNRDGTGTTRLTSTKAVESDPSWFRFSSPAPEERIAFTRRVGGDYEVVALRLGGGETNLSGSTAEDARPSWSPDGQQLLYESRRDGNYELYVMNANGSGQTRLTINPADDLDADWQIAPAGVTDFWVSPNPSGGNPQRRTCTKSGGAGPDRLVGGAGRDVLCGFGGKDVLVGRRGDDYIVGGAGKDVIRGARGRDALLARDGVADTVRGGPGSDRARVDPGRDHVDGVESRE